MVGGSALLLLQIIYIYGAWLAVMFACIYIIYKKIFINIHKHIYLIDCSCEGNSYVIRKATSWLSYSMTFSFRLYRHWYLLNIPTCCIFDQFLSTCNSGTKDRTRHSYNRQQSEWLQRRINPVNDREKKTHEGDICALFSLAKWHCIVLTLIFCERGKLSLRAGRLKRPGPLMSLPRSFPSPPPPRMMET